LRQIEVSYYGVHWDEGPLAFLEQGNNIGSFNTLRGRIKSPFHVINSRPCNHIVPPTNPKAHEIHQRYFENLKKDPLVKAMLPVERAMGSNIFHINCDNFSNDFFIRLTLLSKMSSPIISPVISFLDTTELGIIEELGITNIQPLIVTNISLEDSLSVERICKIAGSSPRTLILIGNIEKAHLVKIQQITTNICEEDLSQLISLPWESLGASEVKYYMQSRRASQSFMDDLKRKP